MNEQMIELYKQAQEFAYKNISKESRNTDNFHAVVSGKFAELIVRECAELIDNKVTITAAQTYDEVFVARYDTKELCAKQIKEHFGVEE